MTRYVIMLYADEDDRLLTQSILDEMENAAPMIFAERIEDINRSIAESGSPAVILVNNQDHLHKAIGMVKQLKADQTLDHIPVVVLGEITSPEYIRQYYRAGANSYIIKPSTIEATRKKIRLFFEYWLNVAEV